MTHNQHPPLNVTITECARCEVWTGEEDLFWHKNHRYCRTCHDQVSKLPMAPNLTELPLDFYVEYTIVRGDSGDRDTPGTNDFVEVDKVYFEGEEMPETIKNKIQFYVQTNPELVGLEMVDGRLS